MESEIGVPRSIIGEIHSLNMQGNQLEGESGVIGSILDHLHS